MPDVRPMVMAPEHRYPRLNWVCRDQPVNGLCLLHVDNSPRNWPVAARILQENVTASRNKSRIPKLAAMCSHGIDWHNLTMVRGILFNIFCRLQADRWFRCSGHHQWRVYAAWIVDVTAATIICSSCSIASVAGASVEGIQAEDCHVSTNDVCCVHCTRQETFKVAASDDKLMMRQKANKPKHNNKSLSTKTDRIGTCQF